MGFWSILCWNYDYVTFREVVYSWSIADLRNVWPAGRMWPFGLLWPVKGERWKVKGHWKLQNTNTFCNFIWSIALKSISTHYFMTYFVCIDTIMQPVMRNKKTVLVPKINDLKVGLPLLFIILSYYYYYILYFNRLTQSTNLQCCYQLRTCVK